MKFDNAIREGYNTYLVSEEAGHVQVPADVLKRAIKIAYDALGTTSYGENEQLMRIYHDTYMDLATIAKEAGINTPELGGTDEEYEDMEGGTDETEAGNEAFDDVNTSDLQKALSLGKQLKSPEVAQATQDLHGKVVNKIRDVTSKLS
jgi:hypothetical protein|tara:strand:+ start:454 stop:897 length:444 start_codon:yes stop_codon:yes gene_type:complete